MATVTLFTKSASFSLKEKAYNRALDLKEEGDFEGARKALEKGIFDFLCGYGETDDKIFEEAADFAFDWANE